MPPDRFTVTSSHHGDGSRSPHDVGPRPRANTTPVHRMRRTSTARRCANQSARRFPFAGIDRIRSWGSPSRLSAFRPLSPLELPRSPRRPHSSSPDLRSGVDIRLKSPQASQHPPTRAPRVLLHAIHDLPWQHWPRRPAGVAFWPDIDMTATAVAGEKADQRHLLGQAGFVADNRCGRISAATRRGGRGRPCRSMDDAACSSPWPRSDGCARR